VFFSTVDRHMPDLRSGKADAGMTVFALSMGIRSVDFDTVLVRVETARSLRLKRLS